MVYLTVFPLWLPNALQDLTHEIIHPVRFHSYFYIILYILIADSFNIKVQYLSLPLWLCAVLCNKKSSFRECQTSYMSKWNKLFVL